MSVEIVWMFTAALSSAPLGSAITAVRSLMRGLPESQRHMAQRRRWRMSELITQGLEVPNFRAIRGGKVTVVTDC